MEGIVVLDMENVLWWRDGIMSKKQSNPKDVLGIKKVPVSTLPATVKYEVGLAMLEGARKYGRHNYRVVGVRASVYYDALNRHIDSWWEGEEIDPDSGLPHLIKAIACLYVLRDSQLRGNCEDDRPPSQRIDFDRLNKVAEDIIKKYPDCVEPFTQKNLDLKEIDEIEFGLNDLVEIPMWPSEQRKNWTIIGFASGGAEAELMRFRCGTRSFVEISKLKHQKENRRMRGEKK